MLCQNFSEAWFNSSHVVARRKLRPFSLWHFSYLSLVDSPLIPGAAIKEGENIGWPDIELASRICQLGYQESLPSHYGLALKARLFITMAKSTVDKEMGAFFSYINDYFAPPRFNEWKDDIKAKKRGGPPDPLSVASAVIMMFGGGRDTEKFVWEMPIGMAYWYSSTLHYNRGAALDYMTARDEAFRAFLREQRQKGLL